jgi:hypothetical protein
MLCASNFFAINATPTSNLLDDNHWTYSNFLQISNFFDIDGLSQKWQNLGANLHTQVSLPPLYHLRHAFFLSQICWVSLHPVGSHHTLPRDSIIFNMLNPTTWWSFSVLALWQQYSAENALFHEQARPLGWLLGSCKCEHLHTVIQW